MGEEMRDNFFWNVSRPGHPFSIKKIRDEKSLDRLHTIPYSRSNTPDFREFIIKKFFNRRAGKNTQMKKCREDGGN